MKRRKIYYVPGMISLIFLPILCVWYLNEQKNIQRCLEVFYFQKYDPTNSNPIVTDTTFLSDPRCMRTYLDFKFIGNKLSDSIQFEKIRTNAHQIISSKDTINGIHIMFGDNIKYGLYIKVISYFSKYNKVYLTNEVNKAFREQRDLYSPLYVLFENQLWFHNYKYPKLKNEVFECQIQCIIVDYKQTTKEKILEWLDNQKVLIEAWKFFIIFAVFSIIAINYTKNKYIKNK